MIQLDFKKQELIPAIIQDSQTKKILMQGYMNEESFNKTLAEKVVWFYSRSKQRLWKKGERSGNVLNVVCLQEDCDNDSLLIQVVPNGPTCHTGQESCFGAQGFSLAELESIIASRIDGNVSDSYTVKMFNKGINKVAQKVGEEATEVVIAALNEGREQVVYESADLLYHLLLLLKSQSISLEEVIKELERRNSK